MVQIITIAQQKGGSGKTTIAAHLAISLIYNNSSVALIDIDPQNSLSTWYAQRHKYSGANSNLHLTTTSGWRISSELARLKQIYDFIIIDSPPHIATETKTAMRAADLVIIPVQPTPTDIWATQATVEISNKERKSFVTLLNRVAPNSKLLQKLGPSLPNLLQNYIGNRVAFASSMLEGKCVLETEPNSIAAREIENIVTELSLGFFNKAVLPSYELA
ncbi:cobyrinic acid a,c-diamide synthase [Rickettsiales bacterium Ac37b]|nr:cobyrinic acid a,c-diamide synthase [Rickettsiales bacterium Ac37b]